MIISFQMNMKILQGGWINFMQSRRFGFGGVCPLMSFQVVRPCAGILAVDANEWPSGIVRFITVCFKISFLFERFFTLVATVRPFSVVREPVSLQSACLGGWIVTLVAQKRFRSSVRVNVSPQIFFGRTWIFTLVAGVWFDTRVHQQMSFHVVTTGAYVLTEWTSVIKQSLLNVFFVDFGFFLWHNIFLLFILYFHPWWWHLCLQSPRCVGHDHISEIINFHLWFGLVGSLCWKNLWI